MFDRFTAQARRAMTMARQEALRLQNGYIGTEHLLLGLLTMEEGAVAQALQSIGVDRARMRAVVEELTEQGTATNSTDQLPFTPRSKRVLELALAEAQGLGHSYIGTEHLMLGLIGERDGPAAHAVESVGAKREDIRRALLEACGLDPNVYPPPSGNGRPLTILGLALLGAVAFLLYAVLSSDHPNVVMLLLTVPCFVAAGTMIRKGLRMRRMEGGASGKGS